VHFLLLGLPSLWLRSPFVLALLPRLNTVLFFFQFSTYPQVQFVDERMPTLYIQEGYSKLTSSVEVEDTA
jgi:hypothetical protein